MIVFEPLDLKERVFEAVEKLDSLSGSIASIDFEDILAGNTNNDNQTIHISEDSPVTLYLWEGDYPSTTLGFFLSITENMNTAKLNDRQSYAQNNNEVDFLLTSIDYNTVMLLEGLQRSNNPVVNTSLIGTDYWKSEIIVEQTKYEISLFKGVCLYHILVEQSGNHDKYYPSYTDDDYFIRIISNDKIDMNVCDALALSFVFELQTTHKLILEFSNGRTNPEDEYYLDDELLDKPYGIFPLLYGRGIGEIISIYSKAKSTWDFDYKILCFTKVFEYISPTIAQEKLYEQVQLKLTEPAVFSPTSDYINELGAIYNKNQCAISKDSELIRLAVMTVTELSDIWEDISVLMKQYKNKNIEELDDCKCDCLEILATLIYDTRNEIAHAKANYTKKGNECPSKYKYQFCNALDKIAVRCIRWFALQADNKRVTISY